MTTVLFTSSPLSPMASASTSSAFAMMAAMGCLMPRLCTA